MKSLTLFRHAKTERESDSGRDFDRILTDRGKEDAARVGQEVRDLGLDFDLVLVSPAARAAETASIAGLPGARFDERIYDAAATDLLMIVQAVGDEIGRLVMVGHNPGFERLASRLIGAIVDMPTGSLIEVELPAAHWRDVGDSNGRVVRFLRPKDLD